MALVTGIAPSCLRCIIHRLCSSHCSIHSTTVMVAVAYVSIVAPIGRSVAPIAACGLREVSASGLSASLAWVPPQPASHEVCRCLCSSRFSQRCPRAPAGRRPTLYPHGRPPWSFRRPAKRSAWRGWYACLPWACSLRCGPGRPACLVRQGSRSRSAPLTDCLKQARRRRTAGLPEVLAHHGPHSRCAAVLGSGAAQGQ